MSEDVADKYYREGTRLPKDQWPYHSLASKPASRVVKYKPPKKPKCNTCEDRGSVFIKVKAGRSRWQQCECQA